MLQQQHGGTYCKMITTSQWTCCWHVNHCSTAHRLQTGARLSDQVPACLQPDKQHLQRHEEASLAIQSKQGLLLAQHKRVSAAAGSSCLLPAGPGVPAHAGHSAAGPRPASSARTSACGSCLYSVARLYSTHAHCRSLQMTGSMFVSSSAWQCMLMSSACWVLTLR